VGIPILRALQGERTANSGNGDPEANNVIPDGASSERGNLLILCVEPMPENYLYIRWNLLANGYLHDHVSGRATAAEAASPTSETPVHRRIRVLNRAVGPRSGDILKLHYWDKASTSSGMFKTPQGIPHDVLHISLDDLVHRHLVPMGATRTVWLKLDCEGCEWAAVAAASEDVFRFLFGSSGQPGPVTQPGLSGARVESAEVTRAQHRPPKIVGELHMLPRCKNGYKMLSPWCDDEFGKRTCGVDLQQLSQCCASMTRLCEPHIFECEGLRKTFLFNGFKC
jgi:FkbM family methyltransferase